MRAKSPQSREQPALAHHRRHLRLFRSPGRRSRRPLPEGPLQGLGPVREVLPQGAMFSIICVLWAVGGLGAGVLHYRGNTIRWSHSRTGHFSSGWPSCPPICWSSAPRRRPLRFRRPAQAAGHEGDVQRGRRCVGVAVAAVRLPRAPGHPQSGQLLVGWAAAAAAMVAYQIVSALTFRVVDAPGGPGGTEAKPDHPSGRSMPCSCAASMCLAFAFLDAAWFDRWTTLPLLVVAALIIVAYRGYNRLSLRFSALEHLYDFSRTMGTASLEPSSMSVDVLKKVCTVMRTRRAELILAEPSGIPRRITFDDRGASGIESITLDEASFVTEAVASGQASLHTAIAQGEAVSTDPIVGEYRRGPRGAPDEPAHHDRRHRGHRSRRGAGQLRRRRPPPVRDAGRPRQHQPRAGPARRGAAVRSRQQVAPGHPRHADGSAQPDVVPRPAPPPP